MNQVQSIFENEYSDEHVSLAEARATALGATLPLPAEAVHLDDACGRVLAQDVCAAEDIVPFARSAMDGYALRSADTIGAAHGTLSIPVDWTTHAGERPASLVAGTVHRISTGAALPRDADAVVRWEDVHIRGASIVLFRPVSPNAHVFPPYEDARCGEVIARAGDVLTPGRLALLAAAGCERVLIHRRPRVGIICTGDELVAVGGQTRPGQVRNSNATMLASHVAHDGAHLVLSLLVGDTEVALRRAFRQALGKCDLLVTTGGASTGERDLVKSVLASMGARFAFTSIAMRPSRPTAFARTSEAAVAILPGNPAAAFVAYVTLVRSVVRRLAGHADPIPQRVKAVVDGTLHGKAERDFLIFASLHHNGQHFVATPLANQCSSLVRTSAQANALIHLPPGEKALRKGATVDAEVLDWAGVTFDGRHDD